MTALWCLQVIYQMEIWETSLNTVRVQNRTHLSVITNLRLILSEGANCTPSQPPCQTVHIFAHILLPMGGNKNVDKLWVPKVHWQRGYSLFLKEILISAMSHNEKKPICFGLWGQLHRLRLIPRFSFGHNYAICLYVMQDSICSMPL